MRALRSCLHRWDCSIAILGLCFGPGVFIAMVVASFPIVSRFWLSISISAHITVSHSRATSLKFIFGLTVNACSFEESSPSRLVFNIYHMVAITVETITVISPRIPVTTCSSCWLVPIQQTSSRSIGGVRKRRSRARIARLTPLHCFGVGHVSRLAPSRSLDGTNWGIVGGGVVLWTDISSSRRGILTSLGFLPINVDGQKCEHKTSQLKTTT